MKNDEPIRFDWAAMNESYHNSMMWSSYQEGYLQGLEEAREITREEGRQEYLLEVAQRALQINFDLETITCITGLPIEKIMQIQQEMKPQSI